MIELLHGDCLDLMPGLESQSIDMILCDLPYGTTACQWDAVIPFDFLWAQYKRIIKPKGAIVLTASQPFTSALVMSNPTWFKHEWIWKKNAGSNFGAVKYAPMKEHESVLVFGAGRVHYYPQKQERTESGKAMIRAGVKSKPSKGADVYGGLNQGYDNSFNDPLMRFPSSVQCVNRERGLHPTQKPVALFEYLVKTYTKEDELVLDNCLGSGTTAIACQRLKRHCVGMEIRGDYYGVASTRLKEAVE